MKVLISSLFFSLVSLPLFGFSWGLRLLGLAQLQRLGGALGAFLLWVGFRKIIVLANLRLAYGSEWDEDRLQSIMKQVYQSIGITFLEIARNFSLDRASLREELIISDEQRKYIEERLQRKKGIVFISAHIANWELLAMGIVAHGIPGSIVVKRMSGGLSQFLIEKRRERSGIGVIYSGGTIEKMREALSKNLSIGFMVDQNVTGKKGIRANFFGTPAASIRALGKLIKETGAAVIPVCAFREADGRCRMHLLPELPFLTSDIPGTDSDRALREEWLNTQQYQTAIETLVRMKPEQWLWIHRRWKASRVPLDFATAHKEND
jgi:Kdo2-lipid IVA lauroyltransferase/acyltransferase